eukprot:s627_g2.t1
MAGSINQVSFALTLMATGRVLWRKRFPIDEPITISRIIKTAQPCICDSLARSHFNTVQVYTDVTKEALRPQVTIFNPHHRPSKRPRRLTNKMGPALQALREKIPLDFHEDLPAEINVGDESDGTSSSSD